VSGDKPRHIYRRNGLKYTDAKAPQILQNKKYNVTLLLRSFFEARSSASQSEFNNLLNWHIGIHCAHFKDLFHVTALNN